MMHIDQLKMKKNEINSVKLPASPSRKFYLAKPQTGYLPSIKLKYV
jgi:hypothetical protein